MSTFTQEGLPPQQMVQSSAACVIYPSPALLASVSSPFAQLAQCLCITKLPCLINANPETAQEKGFCERQGAMAALTVAMGLRNLAGQNAFSSSMIMINLIAPAHAMGAVNGAPCCPIHDCLAVRTGMQFAYVVFLKLCCMGYEDNWAVLY